MFRVIRRLCPNEKGATAIEYGLIAALVSLAALGGLGALGGRLNILFTGFTTPIISTTAAANGGTGGGTGGP